MIAPPAGHGARPALAFNLELTRGRLGASARLELHERPAGGGEGPARVARVALRGCIDAVAAARLRQALDDLALRNVDLVLMDCAELRHIDFRQVPDLVRALDRLEAHSGGVVLSGLSRYLRDLFRLAGCESRLRASGPVTAPLETAVPEPGRERRS